MNFNFAKQLLAGICALALGSIFMPNEKLLAASDSAPQKSLTVYFSRSGHTKAVAEDIHKKMGGDLVEIEVVDAYPEEYEATVDRAKKEQQQNARPAVKTRIPNLEEYDVIFLGYPNWWSSMPMPVYTFIEENKLDGKTIAPFVTHGGGGLGHSITDLKKLAPNSKVLKPFSVSGNSAKHAENDVAKWLEDIKASLK